MSKRIAATAWALGEICGHDHLGRSCELCQLLTDIATLTRERDEARAEVTEALKYGAPVNATSLSFVTHKCGHNDYWKTHDGKNCMACRAERAEADARTLAMHVHTDDRERSPETQAALNRWSKP